MRSSGRDRDAKAHSWSSLPATTTRCPHRKTFPGVSKPAQSTVQDYRLLQQRIGFSRVVIVTPRNYATDNSVTLDAIAQLGIARCVECVNAGK